MRIACFVKRVIRRLRLIKVNRELLVFFVFFLISVGFWFLQTFNENTSISFTYKVKIKNIPSNFILTSSIPEFVSVSVSGRGFDVLDYFANKKKGYVEFDFSDFVVSEDAVVADNALMRRVFQKELTPMIELVSCTPSKMELFYSTGEKKRVPVIFNGKAYAAKQYMLCVIKTTPDSVDLYAKASCFDSIVAVNTIQTEYHGLEDTFSVRLPLISMDGVKLIPDSVNVDVFVDLFTEKSFRVPILCENVPNDMIMRTFPLYANVSFNVGSSLFDDIDEDDFVLTVDYNDVVAGNNVCKVLVKTMPDGVSQLRVSPSNVEYIIEERRYEW